MADGLIIKGINVSTYDRNEVIFFSGTCENNKRHPKLATTYTPGLELEAVREGKLSLSNEHKAESCLGMLVSPKFYDDLFSVLPTPSAGDRYDFIEGPSMFFFEQDFPRKEFTYLSTRFSEIDNYRVEVSSRLDFIDTINAKNFFMPVHKNQVEQIQGLIQKDNVFAYVRKK